MIAPKIIPGRKEKIPKKKKLKSQGKRNPYPLTVKILATINKNKKRKT
jgi:hypothetical protein